MITQNLARHIALLRIGRPSLHTTTAFFKTQARVLSIPLCMVVANGSASASTANTTFNVTANVVSSCQISATALTFGTYTGAQTDATSTITATCTDTTAYTIGVSAGLATGATVTNRYMNGPSVDVLAYAVYRDSARTNSWGTTIGTDTVSGTGNGGAQAITVYGRLAAGQLPVPGAYSDTLTATMTY
ncbi:spore coat U domain-containing protein [Sphingomonas aerolata]|uniref:Csu type fimbrial protein n=1 Tax=Sphingomonas aerolata TaxID=185951 RepID=UPI002FE2DBF5